MKKRTLLIGTLLLSSVGILASCGDEAKSSEPLKFSNLNEFLAGIKTNYTLDVLYSIANSSSGSYSYLAIDDKNLLISEGGDKIAYTNTDDGIVIVQKAESDASFTPYRLLTPNKNLNLYDVVFSDYDIMKELGASAWEDNGDGTYLANSEKADEINMAANEILEVGLEESEILSSSYASLSIEDNKLTWEGMLNYSISVYGSTITGAISYNFIYSNIGSTYDETYANYLKNPVKPTAPTSYNETLSGVFAQADIALPWVEGFGSAMYTTYDENYNMYSIYDCTATLDTAKNLAEALLNNGWSKYTRAIETETTDSTATDDVLADTKYYFTASSDSAYAMALVYFESASSLDDDEKELYPNGILSFVLMIGSVSSAE